MQLQMLTGPETAASPGWGHVEISGLTADSREVQPGWLFAALPGAKADGARFVSDAIAKGAAAVLVKAGADVAEAAHIPVLASAEPRRALALMAARFFAAQPDKIVAVTGTSGKTSVAEFTRQIFAARGRKAASLGTIGLVKPDGSVYGGLTTPDPVTLHRTLAELAGEGFTHLAFEASSDGLAQHRLDAVKLKAAAFTNLGRDHLNTHHTVEAYRDAKLRLFTELLPADGAAVLNADTRNANEELILRLALSCGRRAMTVGTRGETLKLESVARDGFAQRLTVRHAGKSYAIRLPLIGDYQAANALLAAGLAIATGEAADAVFGALETLKGVKGRLEIAGELRGGLVVIDYAHKPDALIAALDALRPFAPGKLVCVFGCGGDRDKGKRPIMGQIAAAKADTVIVTDDNPRSEKPEAIRAEILAGAPGAIEIGDRAEAIRSAVQGLAKGDVLLVAGKGHETGQIIGARVLPFSDHAAVQAALAEAPIHD
ncbi:MAG TPA: UDP-N-acetylmuramoyl-L-alanyl-D-glutamate--2,6-diaminopimelate ligase [Hyphomicrobiaceae bacterium]|nr:UDP-N-acetylmuramoyl-L-alanyl-D-glutamate--2,6-diaminopimelate ligase [Hyphomicrobiaceae bacterium]